MPDRVPNHKPPKARLADGRPSACRRGYDQHWRAIRLDYLQGHPLCQGKDAQGRPCNQPATEVDHVVALVKGGTHDESNLIGYCKSCHARKTCAVDSGFGRKPKE